MSISASINLRIVDYHSGAVVSPIKTITMLTDYGWNLINLEGSVFYLPVGDDDMFNWTDGKMDLPSLIKILEAKELKNELIGIGIRWQNTDIGGEILLWTEKAMLEKKIHTSMSFCIDGSRKSLFDEGYPNITDVNWYLKRLLPIFSQDDTLIEYYTYNQHI